MLQKRQPLRQHLFDLKDEEWQWIKWSILIIASIYMALEHWVCVYVLANIVNLLNGSFVNEKKNHKKKKLWKIANRGETRSCLIQLTSSTCCITWIIRFDLSNCHNPLSLIFYAKTSSSSSCIALSGRIKKYSLVSRQRKSRERIGENQ